MSRQERGGYHLSIVGIVGLPASYGGFETLAENLVRQLGTAYKIQVFCSATDIKERRPTYLNADLQFVSLRANGWQSIPYDILSMWKAAACTQSLLVLGVSGCLFLPILRWLRPDVRVVTNVDGVEWRRRKWGLVARAILRASERAALRYSHAVTADNEVIRDYLQSTYGREPHLIAYGGDAAAASVEPTRISLPFPPNSYFLAVCRIEPENNVAEILEAFASSPAKRLAILGNWSASRYARRLFERFTKHQNIKLLAPIYDQSRLDALRKNARGYIHGHSAGGTNPSLVESMMAGMAVLAYDAAYNRYTTSGLALYWSTPNELSRLVESLNDDVLESLSRSMQEYAKKHYIWKDIVAQYEEVLFGNAPQDRNLNH